MGIRILLNSSNDSLLGGREQHPHGGRQRRLPQQPRGFRHAHDAHQPNQSHRPRLRRLPLRHRFPRERGDLRDGGERADRGAVAADREDVEERSAAAGAVLFVRRPRELRAFLPVPALRAAAGVLLGQAVRVRLPEAAAADAVQRGQRVYAHGVVGDVDHGEGRGRIGVLAAVILHHQGKRGRLLRRPAEVLRRARQRALPLRRARLGDPHADGNARAVRPDDVLERILRHRVELRRDRGLRAARGHAAVPLAGARVPRGEAGLPGAVETAVGWHGWVGFRLEPRWNRAEALREAGRARHDRVGVWAERDGVRERAGRDVREWGLHVRMQ